MSILILGFGVQVGLFSLVKKGFVFTGVSGGISGISMVACCAHHVADIIPILGLSGASLFLVQYQKEFLFLGIIFNLIGIAYGLRILTKKQ